MNDSTRHRYGANASPFGFEDLDVYKAARALRRRVYKLTGLLPNREKFALVQQMIRAAVSVTSNIAEGYGRHHWQENIRFCRQSRGSLLELVDAIGVCGDEQYAQREHLADLRKDAAEVLRLVNGYIAYLRRQKEIETKPS